VNRLRPRTIRSFTASLAAAATLAASFAISAPSAGMALAASCTITENGSTTVFPALENARPGFLAAAAQNGCTLTDNATGTGAGKTAVNSEAAQVGAASSPLSASDKLTLYSWKVGGDALVIQVSSSANMSFITQITPQQVHDIWTGALTNWSQGGLGGPNQPILADCRIIGSGTRDDMFRVFALGNKDANPAVDSCASRLTTSAEEAAAAKTDYHIVYTSLVNDNIPGTKSLKLSGGAPITTGIGSAGSFVTASVASVQNGTYPAPRTLYVTAKHFDLLTTGSATTTTNFVKGYDFINWMTSSAGQTSVNAVGFVVTSPYVAIPDYDVNLDGVVSLPDLGQITGKWTQSDPVPGWIRADVNNDGAISLPDIGGVTGHWGGTGFVAQP
jgi:ABC-type phosphate transport system substrate-binding protein